MLPQAILLPMKYWLIKSEPSTYSIDDLKKEGVTYWDGVRNYQARNFMRDQMKKGDLILFYHSNAEPPGVAGIAKVAREGYPDKKDPEWSGVDVEFVSKLKRFVPLEELKANKKLAGMLVIKKGTRLSVQPVGRGHFDEVVKLGGGG
jgi:predicted RNA-binding protein with PUA-like domain